MKKILGLGIVNILAIIGLQLPVLITYADSNLTVQYWSGGSNSINFNTGESGQTPTVFYEGVALSSSASYTWTSSNTSVVSFDSTDRDFTASAPGSTTLTVTYQGDSTTFAAAVENQTSFSGAPYVIGTPTILFLNTIGVGVGINGLQEVQNDTFLAGKTVTFYSEPDTNPSDKICSATTDSNGDATCLGIVTDFNGALDVYAVFTGDSVDYGCTSEVAD